MKVRYLSFFCTFLFLHNVSLYTSDHKPYYLALMLPEILNHIASFLPFPDRETEEECVARTLQLETVPCELWKEYEVYEWWAVANSVFAAYDPYKTKFAFFEKVHCGYNHLQSKFTIVDTKKRAALHRYSELSNRIDGIALSQTATVFAFIQSVGLEKDFLLNVFSTADVSKTTHAFDLSRCACHYSTIAFNKQGTQLTAHHKKTQLGCAISELSTMSKCTVSVEKPYTFFPLKSSDEITKAEQKTLQHYFYIKRVCKNLSLSICS